jgi:hypothetical protein
MSDQNPLDEVFWKGEGQCPLVFSSPPPLSTHLSSPSPPRWLSDEVGKQLEVAMKLLPVSWQGFVHDVAKAWMMEEGVILVAALHQLAACCGRLHRIRRGYRGLSCPFNVIVCSHSRSRISFMEYLAEPWVERVRVRIRAHQVFAARRMFQETEAGTDGGTTPQMLLLPFHVVQSPKPSAIIAALNGSHDRAVMSLAGAMDPAAELLLGGARDIAELGAILSRSWLDMDVFGVGDLGNRCLAHIGWRARMGAVRQLVLGKHSPWRICPPPVLLLRQQKDPGFLVGLPEEVFKMWSEQLIRWHSARSTAGRHIDWDLSPGAQDVWGAFEHELLHESGALTPFPSTYFDWLPELMLRLAMLVEMLRGTDSALKPVIEVPATQIACALTRWLAHEHLECLRALLPPPSGSLVDEFDGALGDRAGDAMAIEAGILSRLAEKGPLLPRELTRTFNKLPADVRDNALVRLEQRGLVIRDEEGRLALFSPAGTRPSAGKGTAAAASPLIARKFPCRAVWKNAHCDKPVTIVKWLGKQEGKTYFQSSDGTGIPGDELQFEENNLP